MTPRAMPDWGRKVARLPDRGTLLFATDLQGNRRDYEAMKTVYFRELAAGNEPVLVFCGDLVHGPSPDMDPTVPGTEWPEHLGTPYPDESAELIRDFERFTRYERALSLMGNHEHAHVGGPVVPKFHPDEAAVLEAALGTDRAAIRAFFWTFPLLAVAPCGVVLTHGAPARTERDLAAFERLSYAGFEQVPLHHMIESGTVGGLLWARSATESQARALLAATALDPSRPNAFVAFGHDIVHEGYALDGPHQLCLSTSFGCFDVNKHYLRLDLGRRYTSARELIEGQELLPLYP